MKSPSVADLAPGQQQVTGVFLVQYKEVRQKRTGEPYLSLTIGDRTGEVEAKMWDNVAEIAETFERDDFIRIKGEVSLFNNRLQFTIHRLQRVQDGEVDLADFLPSAARDPEEMFGELRTTIASLTNPHLRGLLEAIFADETIAAAYKRAPAAKGIHHAWLGGLIEHVLSLCKLAEFTSLHYPWVDRDLLVTGVVLHDIGKIRELGYQRTFHYTTEGQLLGHMQIALRIVGDKIGRLPDFPPKLRDLVEHLILSHHGKLEYGSPKVPLFAEALLLHHLDNLDSKMESMRATVARDRNLPGEWTNWNQALERPVLNLEKYFAPAPQPTPALSSVSGETKSQQREPARRGAQATLFGSALKAAMGDETA